MGGFEFKTYLTLLVHVRPSCGEQEQVCVLARLTLPVFWSVTQPMSARSIDVYRTCITACYVPYSQLIIPLFLLAELKVY